MIKYRIDYEYGVADFYTEERNPQKAVSEFKNCASICFGIRKSMGDTSIIATYPDSELPLPYRGHGGTHFLSHNGDDILFDYGFMTPGGDPWKLRGEWGEWCSCKKRGVPELSCSVHHFYVPNHDKVCDCLNREKK